MRKMFVTVMLLAMAGSAMAADPACKVNFKQEGSYLSGRRFSSWDVVPGVSAAVAYKRIYAEGVKSGLTVASSDKEMGMITFQQLNAGEKLGGQSVNVPWNVVIEAEGKAVRVTVTKTTPSGYSTSQDFQIKSLCAVIDAARNP